MEKELFKKIEAGVRGDFLEGGLKRKWEHTMRVHRLCMNIAGDDDVDLDVLQLASMLHDVGKIRQLKEGGCHAKISVDMAEKILEDYDIEEDVVKNILHCIREHRLKTGRPKTKEAKILFDADKIDSVGYVGIARAFICSGEINADLHNRNVDDVKSWSEEDTAYRRYIVKLEGVKDLMLTEEGKKIAEERQGVMKDFFKELDREIFG